MSANLATGHEPRVVQFTQPGTVEVVAESPVELRPHQVRVRTLYSGISAGTELTAYRGSHAYLVRRWEPDVRLFRDAATSVDYPVIGWGYSEVGQVVELGRDVPAGSLAVGTLVHGVWGHRSDAVVAADDLAWQALPDGADPLTGVFIRPGGSHRHLRTGGVTSTWARPSPSSDRGVIGLLGTRLATLSGARVVAVDGIDTRLSMARTMGAATVVDFRDGSAAEQLKQRHGPDVVIELSGSQDGLAEAILAAPGGSVIAAGFYQGDASGLRLADEFHHNRVRLISSQIGSVPPSLADRWSVARLHRVVDDLVQSGALDVWPLVSHIVPVDDASEAYELLDAGSPDVLQVVLDFRPDPTADRGAR